MLEHVQRIIETYVKTEYFSTSFIDVRLSNNKLITYNQDGTSGEFSGIRDDLENYFYLRVVQEAVDANEKITSCGIGLMQAKLRLVAVAWQTKPYSLSGFISTRLKSAPVRIKINSVNTDYDSIWNTEMPGKEKKRQHNMVVVAIDFDVKFQIKQVFAKDPCEYDACETDGKVCKDGLVIIKDQSGEILIQVTVASGGTEERTIECHGECLDATAILKDTAGNILSTTDIPSGDTQDIVAPDGNVELNGTPVTNVASGGTVDIPVLQDGNPIGSLVGSDWIIPTCPPSADAIIEINSTPEFTVAPGATIDIGLIDQDSVDVPYVKVGNDLQIYRSIANIDTSLFRFIGDASGLVANTTNAFGTVNGSGGCGQLTDLTGNGLHFTQADGMVMPLLAVGSNGFNCLEFDGNKWLDNPSSASWIFWHNGQPKTAIIIMKAGNVANPDAMYAIIGGYGSTVAGTIGANMLWDNRIVTGSPRALRYIASNNGAVFPGLVVRNDSITPNVDLQIVTLRGGHPLSLGGNLQWVFNTEEGGGGVVSAAGTTAPSNANPTYPMQIGAGGNNYLPLVGQIQWIGLAPSVLTPQQYTETINQLRQNLAL